MFSRIQSGEDFAERLWGGLGAAPIIQLAASPLRKATTCPSADPVLGCGGVGIVGRMWLGLGGRQWKGILEKLALDSRL